MKKAGGIARLVFSGESHEGWAPYMDDLLAGLRQVHGSDFEAVDTGPVLNN